MQQEAPREGEERVSEKLNSLMESLHRNLESRSEKVALGRKVEGSWREVSYRELYGKVESFAAGLAAMGVERGSRVALMSTNRPEWPVADLAVQSLGAVTVPVYPTLEAGQVAHILDDSGAGVAVVENEELRDRVESVRDRVSGLRDVILMDGEAGEARSFGAVEEAGSGSPLSGWEEGWRAIGREDVATIIYTSGTTGLPKGVVLTQGNLLSNLEGIQRVMPTGPDDIFLSFLPLSHIFERTAGQYHALDLGATTYYAESVEKVPENLREVRPTVTLSVPRLYEKMYDRVQAQISTAPSSRQRLFRAAIEAGKRKYEIEKDGGTPGFGLRAQLALYDRLVFKKVRQAVGGRLRFFVSGGAKLNGEIGKFFYAAGIKILEGYGLTETSPVLACNTPERPRFGTVGQPLPNVEIRLSDEGEIQARGPNIMRGYHNDETATAEAFTEDGFYRTGDVGQFDEAGYLEITDRAKNILVLSTGKNVAPQPLETAITAAPHVSQAVLLGDGQKYVSALVVPDYEAVRRSLGGDGAPDEELAADERVRSLIERDLDAATAGFAAYERPKRFALLPRELSQEHGELTPTLKVKLPVVQEQYGQRIEELYAGE
ncbi:MAG: long-chain fatty acid--CoA ligase [Rubrobacter sp.]|nr:long-chain fatty acid--CoA ligase [Rubrobacter sp.]